MGRSNGCKSNFSLMSTFHFGVASGWSSRPDAAPTHNASKTSHLTDIFILVRLLRVLLIMPAAILAGQLHKKVFQRAPDGIHGNHFAPGLPYFLDGAVLIQRGNANIDIALVVRSVK